MGLDGKQALADYRNEENPQQDDHPMNYLGGVHPVDGGQHNSEGPDDDDDQWEDVQESVTYAIRDIVEAQSVLFSGVYPCLEVLIIYL